MRQVTFSTVRESVRVLYDLPAFSTNTKPTLAQINSMVNASAARLSGILCQYFGDDYFTKTATVATVASTATSALPSDFYKLRSLVWLQTSDNPVEIQRATLEDYAQESLLTARAWSEAAPAYRFQGASTIRWLPTPNAIYSVVCTYVFAPATLAADADTIDAGPGWEEWIVNDVCVRIAQLREEDPSVYMAERADCEQRIKGQAPQRDPYAVIQARDVRGMSRCGDGRGRGGWYANGRYKGRWG